TKKTDVIDDISDSVKHVDKIGDAGKHYETIKTLNQDLIGRCHEKTGIEFIRKNLDLSDGRHITGVFPKFDAKVEIKLPDKLLKEKAATHLKYLSETLKEQANTPAGRKELEKIFDSNQMKDILNGIIPEGFTWHHSETEGLMQLVDSEIHNATNHTGGMSIWGIGY
ncbi:MAG: HNH endonuclease, partial [Eubacteriales bacterium]|nr:HNH endonuclease [Eubacteriales bacterium]